MDFEFYRNFITVAETGNLTAAASKLSLAQPALSSQIKTLEKHYGVKLINTARGKRNISLTEAGTDFLTKAKQICAQEETILMNMENYKQEASGTLHFAVSHGMVNMFMKNYLQPFTNRYPTINFQLQEIPASEQIAAIRNGTTDFAFANAPMPAMENFVIKPLNWVKFYVVFVDDNKFHFRPKRSITLEKIKGLPLSTNQGSYDLLQKQCRNYGFMPNVKFLSDNGIVAIRFATNGQCIAIASQDCAEQLPPNMSKILIKDKDFTFQQTLFWSSLRKQSAAAKLFLDFINK